MKTMKKLLLFLFATLCIVDAIKIHNSFRLSNLIAPCLLSLNTLLAPFSIHDVAVATNREVASIPTSGLIFKDNLKINSIQDPKVKGVAIYLSDFERPLTEKLSKDFFNDPSSSSLTCVKTGEIELSKDISLSSEGEEVFEESRNLFFKQIRVRRVIDKEGKAIIYASYSTRFDKNDDSNKGRFKSSLCAIPLQ